MVLACMEGASSAQMHIMQAPHAMHDTRMHAAHTMPAAHIIYGTRIHLASMDIMRVANIMHVAYIMHVTHMMHVTYIMHGMRIMHEEYIMHGAQLMHGTQLQSYNDDVNRRRGTMLSISVSAYNLKPLPAYL